jgi:hypothetical protein
MTEPLQWHEYVKLIEKQEKLTYHQAQCVASKTWPEYKAKHGVKPRTSKQPEVCENDKPAKEDGERKPAKRASAPRKPRVTKAQKQKEEMEKLRLKAELLETKEELRKQKKQKKKKKDEESSDDE